MEHPPFQNHPPAQVAVDQAAYHHNYPGAANEMKLLRTENETLR